MNTEDENAILARHKKETKELTGRITGMKKQANKNTRKAVMKQIKDLEDEMKDRHHNELKQLRGEAVETGEEETEEVTPEMLLAQLELEQKDNDRDTKDDIKEVPAEQIPKKKRNRQKEKLAKREAEMKRIQEEARKEQDSQPDLRGMELDQINKLCEMKNLVQYDITPDGNCLYSSIADQLKIRQNIEVTVKELREKAGEFITANPDDFIPFLFDEETMSLKNIDEYVDKLVNTVVWGGDLEILALSKVYDCPISVMMSGRSELRMNEEGSNTELKLVYYQHVFGLGEHYNSLHDK